MRGWEGRVEGLGVEGRGGVGLGGEGWWVLNFYLILHKAWKSKLVVLVYNIVKHLLCGII